MKAAHQQTQNHDAPQQQATEPPKRPAPAGSPPRLTLNISRRGLLPIKAPAGKVSVNVHTDGKLWTRLHLDERIWNAMEALAKREAATVDEICSRAFEDAIAHPGGIAGYLQKPRNQRGGVN